MVRTFCITPVTLGTLLIAFLLMISGCESTHNKARNITIENELCTYSFSYPSRYKLEQHDNFGFNVPYSYLILEGPIEIKEAEVFDPASGEIKTVLGRRGTSVISVNVADSKSHFGELYSAVNKIDNVLEAEARWANFQLLKRVPRSVSGVTGEMVVYLVDKLMPIPVEDGENLEYVRALYFDYDGLLWEIRAKCDQNIKEQVEADFEHIAQSFKILE